MLTIPPSIAARLDPDFVTALYTALGPLPATYVGTRGVPPAGQQAALYARHLADPTFDAAPPGHSAHEEHPTVVGAPRAGLALDFGVEEADGSLTYHDGTDGQPLDPRWQAAWDAIKASPDLHSGHSFPEDTGGKVPCDNDHVEDLRWRHVRAFLQANGQW